MIDFVPALSNKSRFLGVFFVYFAQKRFSDCVALNWLPMKTINCLFMLIFTAINLYHIE